MNEQKCMNCRFSRCETIGQFSCRVHGPVHGGSWPMMDQEDWCGLWRSPEEPHPDDVFQLREGDLSEDLDHVIRKNIQQLAASFVQTTGLDPTDVVLVHKISNDKQEVYFRPRSVDEREQN